MCELILLSSYASRENSQLTYSKDAVRQGQETNSIGE